MRSNFTKINELALLERFLHVKDRGHAILEIGVSENLVEGSTAVFLKNKKKNIFYAGIDLEDRSFLNNPNENIYTIKNDSNKINENMFYLSQLGIKYFDFIFIDGGRGISQLMCDWEYTKWLSPIGYVAFHETNSRQDIDEFFNILNINEWHIVKNVCKNDVGLGFVWKRNR